MNWGVSIGSHSSPALLVGVFCCSSLFAMIFFICARGKKKKKGWQVFTNIKIFVKHSCYFGMYVVQWISHCLVWGRLSKFHLCQGKQRKKSLASFPWCEDFCEASMLFWYVCWAMDFPFLGRGWNGGSHWACSNSIKVDDIAGFLS